MPDSVAKKNIIIWSLKTNAPIFRVVKSEYLRIYIWATTSHQKDLLASLTNTTTMTNPSYIWKVNEVTAYGFYNVQLMFKAHVCCW
jgi:hypothetical protein